MENHAAISPVITAMLHFAAHYFRVRVSNDGAAIFIGA
jgi:hypothetical protein